MSREIELAHLIRMASNLRAWKVYAWEKAQILDATYPGISQALKDAMSSAKSEGAAPPRSR